MAYHDAGWQAQKSPYFQKSHHLESGLLRLDPSLRNLIYRHLGVCGATASEQAEYGGRCIFNLNGPRRPEQPQIGFHGLLLSCRLVYHELSRLLYATNSFTIQYSDPESLELLRNFRPQTCASLTSLRVILAATSCQFTGSKSNADWVYGAQCRNRAPAWEISSDSDHKDWPDKPVDALDPRLAEWDMTMSYLASTISVGILDLSVVCDVCPGPTTTSLQAARSVVSSLLRLPKLKDCSVRLCQKPERELQQLAHETTLRARHIIPPSSSWAPTLLEQPCSPCPSRLLTLPAELRLRILQFTDLITPWTEVRWSPQHQHFIVGITYCEYQEFRGETCPPSRHYGCQFHRCDLTFPQPTPGCFCRQMHGASSSTVVCKCWAPPQALFLVCKALYKDAQAVFFSGNRFVVFDRHSDPPWNREVDWDDREEGYLNPRLGASRFLREIVPTDCLRHLRFLELVYPAWDYNVWPQDGQACLQEWKDTLAWAGDHLNVGSLTVRLIAMDASDWEQPLSRRKMTREQGVQVIAGYMRLLGPLSGLGELRRFYAQLVSPWRWNEGGRGSEESVATMERMLKERAEKLIMGDRYLPPNESYEEPEESVWHRQYERDA